MPVALPFIAIALAAAGTGVGVYAAVQESKAAQGAAKYNEKVANNNALAASQQASFDAQQIRRRNLILSGRQRSAAAKAGVLLTGSFGDVAQDTAVQGELEALSRLYTGAVASQAYVSEAKLQHSAAKNAKIGGNLKVAGTLLTGSSQIVGAAGAMKFPSFASSGAATASGSYGGGSLATSRTSGLQSLGRLQ